MSFPKLTKSSVDVRFSADDGYRSQAGFKGTPDNPALGLLGGLEELARLTALVGLEDEALRGFTEARQRVTEWRQSQKQKNELEPAQ